MPQPYHLRSHSKQGREHSDLWLPSGIKGETFSRRGATIASVGLLTSQRLALALVELATLDSLSTITFHASTGPTAISNQWFALYDYSTLAKLGVTADDGSTAWSNNTAKTLYISRSVTDAVATAASAAITSATAAFTQSDVGKQVTFMGAGAAGVPLGTSAARVTISSVESATEATLSAAASTSVASNGTLYIATPYSPTATGLAYLGIMVNGTVGTLLCSNQAAGLIPGLAPNLCQASTASLTAATGAPNPAANLANLSAVPYAYVS